MAAVTSLLGLRLDELGAALQSGPKAFHDAWELARQRLKQEACLRLRFSL